MVIHDGMLARSDDCQPFEGCNVPFATCTLRERTGRAFLQMCPRCCGQVVTNAAFETATQHVMSGTA